MATVDEVKHDTGNLRQAIDGLGKLTSRIDTMLSTGTQAPSKVAVTSFQVAAGLLGTVAAAGLIWGVTQMTKVPALEERVDGVRSSVERLTNAVNELRQTAISAAGEVTMRRAEIATSDKRMDEMEMRRREVDSNIIGRLDRMEASTRDMVSGLNLRIIDTSGQLTALERRIADMLLRRGNTDRNLSSEELLPFVPVEALHGNRP